MIRTISTTNPSTGETLATYDLLTTDEAKRLVDRSKKAFDSDWSKLSVSQRAEYFRSLAKAMRSKKADYAKIMTLEMGKPITQSNSEVEKCAWSAEIFADKAEEWLAEEKLSTDAKTSLVSFEPLGVILSIMPWNFPFSQVFRFAVPTLIAGNTAVLKHSKTCTGSALAIQEIFDKAGFPEGVFRALVIGHDVVEDLIAYDVFRGVAITGSVQAGVRIAELAGRNLKKAVLELGGSDAFIVLEDADVVAAAKGAADARLLNSGQSCINGKRFIVVAPCAKEFTERFVAEVESRKLGDPLDERTAVGPLATASQVQILKEQVDDSLSKGGRVETAERRIEGGGSYFSPTVISKVQLGMKIMREEVFGPVAPVYVVEDEEEALSVANGTEFGLGASLWTRDLEKAMRLARRLESGMVTINAPVRSDPRMPFGGIKKSGIGRENSKTGMREFVNVKSIRVY